MILVFIFMTTFGVMNVIIGVIVDNTMSASQSTAGDIKVDLGRIECAFACPLLSTQYIGSVRLCRFRAGNRLRSN